ncbi:uroporphyrinogen-III synthase [Noviherbaspirillum sp. CPCC 100848]|uniref:Uroporphyrinogen-III synthase n=1 Tax=Noviherbaspirillum album TaxID=3080276 RepID=A0ABU6JG20_9BURK|nr:uroporphyrinogen-III synthase [Noviherbaspirillum sp. CPCC 100848]MEC4722142.1 uroporphyrinogen-III synthase [Noviherbaspirillum sp. CPCC 100848]
MIDSRLPPVIVTRPLAQAEPLAQRIAGAGRRAVVFPLLEIHPLGDETTLRKTLRALGDYAMVAFVSPNAIHAAMRHIEEWPAQVAIAVVGEGSKAALAAHGITPANFTIFSPRDAHRTDSQTLLEALDAESMRGRRVLIVRGETGRELLADALRAHGAEVEQLAAYRRIAPRLDDAAKAQLQSLAAQPADWLITSSEALRILLQLVREVIGEEGVVKMQQQNIYVPHVRIAETANAMGFLHVVETGSGDDQLIAALQFRA